MRFEPPKSKKVPKRGPKCGWIKQQDMDVFPKSKLIVYIGRSETNFWIWLRLQKQLQKGQKEAQKGPNCDQIKSKRWSCTFTQSIMQVKSFFKVSFLGFVDALVMCILGYSQPNQEIKHIDFLVHPSQM